MPDYVGGDKITMYGDGSTGKKVVVPPRPKPRPRPRTVLMLAATPMNAPQLRLDEEYRTVRAAIRTGVHREQLKLEVGSAARYSDALDRMSEHKPAIVHFAGHGDADGLAFLDEYGRSRTVTAAVLEDLFDEVGDSVTCVVLNACLTHAQASAIAAHGPAVVGMARSVPDDVAIRFAEGFYRAIADGNSVSRAFRLGRNRLEDRRYAAEPVLVPGAHPVDRLFVTREAS